jgi:alpha-L-rhamnosidase
VVLPAHPDQLVIQITGGQHSWDYEIEAGDGPVQYTMDTPLRTLSGDPKVWRAVTEAFGKHFPGIPLDGSAPEAASVSLNVVLDHIPGASHELQRDLVAAISGQEGNH